MNPPRPRRSLLAYLLSILGRFLPAGILLALNRGK